MQGGRQLLPAAWMSQGGPWQSRALGVCRRRGMSPMPWARWPDFAARTWIRHGPVPPRRRRRLANLPLAGAGQGGKGPAPLTPGLWFMPTVGKAPSSGILSTGREPHAIHGVTLPCAVILTAHRLRSSLPSAR